MPSALLPLLAVTFVDILGFSVMIPILPFYAQHFGASPLVVGLLISSFALCSFISSPILGSMSDRIGRRGILLYTQIMTTLSYIVLGIGGSLTMVFAGRIVEGLAGGGIGVTQAYVSDVTEPNERSRAYALLGATYGVGFIVGPALGSALVRFGYAVPFFTAAAISLVTIALTLRFLPESHTPLELPTPWRATVKAMAVPHVRKVLGIQLCFSLAFTMWVTVLALYLQRSFGLGPSQTGLFYALSGVIGVIVQTLIVGRLVPLLRERRILVLSLFIAAVGYGCVIGIHMLAQFVVLSLLWSFGSSLTRPMLSTLLAQSADQDQRGAIFGGADAINNFTLIIGPLLSTSIFAFNSRLVGVIPAMLALIAAYLAFRLPQETQSLSIASEAEAA